MTENRSEALARLDAFVGEWIVEAVFPGDQPAPANVAEDGPQAHSRFEWSLDGQFLLQRTEIPIPEAPDSLTIVSRRRVRTHSTTTTPVGWCGCTR